MEGQGLHWENLMAMVTVLAEKGSSLGAAPRAGRVFAPLVWENMGNFSPRCGGGFWEVQRGEEVEQQHFRGALWENPSLDWCKSRLWW